MAGAGAAGIKAALDLAAVGYRVLLTDSSPVSGGILSQLDHQFPNNHCGMCQMLPAVDRDSASEYCMRRGLFHENIELMPLTSITAVQGEAGAFAVELGKQPSFVDQALCLFEGACVEVCPVEVPDEFNQGLTRRKAIYRPVPQQACYCIDPRACTRCGECVKICPSNAINLDAKSELLTVHADAIIAASGMALDDPTATSAERGSLPNVLTSLGFERLLSLTPARANELHRPSDGKVVKRIAWIQCTGSRDRRRDRDYCSSICCMFALKEAMLAREKAGEELEPTVFYMDMRAFGKGHHRYREQAEREYGVRLVQCRVHDIVPLADGDLRIRYVDPASGNATNEVFQLVVLSTGQSPGNNQQELAQLLGFPEESLTAPGLEKVATPKAGVFVCGSLTGLSDISESIISGSAAASEADKFLAGLGRAVAAQKPLLPVPREKSAEQPRTAVILCRCLEWTAVESAIGRRLGNGSIHMFEDLCKAESAEHVSAVLRTDGADRVLFGACRPHLHHRLRLMAEEAGINRALIRVVDAWKERAPIPAVRAALEQLKAADPVAEVRIPVTQGALVVGGGVAGMRAAVSLAERGIPVHLVERSEKLGGRVSRDLRYTLESLDPQQLAATLQKKVLDSPRITVCLKAEVVESSGAFGRFRSLVRKASGEEVLVSHGAAILATGGEEAKTKEYGYGTSDRIVTQAELELRLADGTLDPQQLQTVVMIQCVGSRLAEAHDYCSRVCCAAALKNAFRILDANPAARIVILNRDIMTYGRLERFYTEARGKGILFPKYDRPPEVFITENSIDIRFTDQILRKPVALSADLLVLSAGIEPDPANARLAKIFGVETDVDGFFREADQKWRPLDFLKDGIFMAGVAHSPQPLREVIAQAEASAQRAFACLSQAEAAVGRSVSIVRHTICARCLACIESCPYGARTLDVLSQQIEVDPAGCKGCGSCATVCPSGAAEVLGFDDRQVMSALDALLEGN